MPKRLDYGNMMHAAMRTLIQDVLKLVSEEGLPGEHHFFITFDTTHPHVELSDWLRERYPEEMTIVLQHWFDALEVRNTGFSVTLNFGDQPESLTVPFDAIRTFVDPSVEFGLRFETQEIDVDELGEADEIVEIDKPTPDVTPIAPERKSASDADTPSGDAEVVSLDSFRK
ncbi:MAG: ClpXP protease specificity-enhancing factor SspB [Dinoroseobacter sp.]|nr:ClpXP protease specificity-enhancing factor SspB [Dinoroseobacter sp.]MDJ0994120.1 ClpXP protease specificity-enhancing factor SspB [Dinoroseobacter sp.]